jgi:hypothetical protein
VTDGKTHPFSYSAWKAKQSAAGCPRAACVLAFCGAGLLVVWGALLAAAAHWPVLMIPALTWPLLITLTGVIMILASRRWCCQHGLVCPHCASPTWPAVVEQNLGYCPHCKRLMVRTDVETSATGSPVDHTGRCRQSVWYARERAVKRRIWLVLSLITALILFLPLAVHAAASEISVLVGIAASGLAGLGLLALVPAWLARRHGLICPHCKAVVAASSRRIPGARALHLDGQCPSCGRRILRPD